MCMAKNFKVNIDSEEFRNSFRPHMPPSRASTEEPIQKEALKSEVSKQKKQCLPRVLHLSWMNTKKGIFAGLRIRLVLGR